ncbi:hypothetical protein LV779_30020 [Streptomyces thinghirensis]|nr:hypothetical protein [Streptomyces thinghirensis]
MDPAGPDHRANREAMLAKLADLGTEHAKALAGGGAKHVAPAPGTRQTPRPRAHRAGLDPDTPFLEPVSAGRLGQRVRRGRLPGHRHRHGRGAWSA